MFLRRITLSLLCAAALTGCGGSTPGAPPGTPVPVPQLPSVTAFRDCAALRIIDLVGLMDRLEAILSGADTPSVLQALGIVLTPVPGAPNTFDFQASFDLDADGVDDSFSGRIAFSGDPAQLGPGDTAQVSWDYAGGTGDVTGSGDLDITLTVDGATVSGMGMFTSTDGCEFNFMIPASDPLPIDFGLLASPIAQMSAPNLEVQALTLGGVEIVGRFPISITIGGDTFAADVVFQAGNNNVLYQNATITDAAGTTTTLPPGQFPVFPAGLPQGQILALVDAAVLKIGLMHTILEKSWEIGRSALDPARPLPVDLRSTVTFNPPTPDVRFIWRLPDLGIPGVGTATNVRVTGRVTPNNEMYWDLTSDGRTIEGANTFGIPIFHDPAMAGVQNADGNIVIRGPEYPDPSNPGQTKQDRICVFLFSNVNLTFTPAGTQGSVTRFGLRFPGANQSGLIDDSSLSGSLTVDGTGVTVDLLSAFLYDVSRSPAVRINLLTPDPSLMPPVPPLPRTFTLNLP